MLTELRDGVWWLECTGVNAYLVDDGGALTLVDAGTPFDAATIAAGIDAAGFRTRDLERIVLTHYDLDHVGSVAKLAVDAPVFVGAADAGYVTGARRPRLGGPKELIQLVSGPIVPDVAADRVHRIDDGDEVGGFVAYHTPGHTPGHTAYVHEGREAAFLGDAVVERDGALRPSPWLLSYDTGDVRRSVREFAARAPDFEVAAMGHGTPFMRGGGDRLRDLAETL